MAGDVKTYDAKYVIVIFNGVPITGFADGTFISVAPSSDLYTKVVGADGNVSRSRSNDDTAEVTITLAQTSLSNDFLTTQMLLDKTLNAGKGSLQIKDLLGTSLHFFLSAWVKSKPNTEYAKDLTDRVWVFDTGQADIETIGGNI